MAPICRDGQLIPCGFWLLELTGVPTSPWLVNTLPTCGSPGRTERWSAQMNRPAHRWPGGLTARRSLGRSGSRPDRRPAQPPRCSAAMGSAQTPRAQLSRRVPGRGDCYYRRRCCCCCRCRCCSGSMGTGRGRAISRSWFDDFSWCLLLFVCGWNGTQQDAHWKPCVVSLLVDAVYQSERVACMLHPLLLSLLLQLC